MTDSTERLLVRIDATTEQLRRQLKLADKAMADSDKKMQSALGRMSSGWKNADKWVQKHNAQIKLFGVAAVGALAGATKVIVGYSDQYKQLQGQLKLVTGSQEELNSVWDQSLALSNATGASLDSTVNLYARMARSTEDLGLSQEQLFEITKAINQSMVVSGASAQEADSAILQLSQGMASGALRGEELNSVMENSPRLARALADGLDVGIGKLREMGANGELTSEAVTGALLKMGDSIDAEFQEMPVTVARATNEVKNLLADAFGKADLSGITESILDFGEALSDPDVINGLTSIATGIANVANASVSFIAGMGGMSKAVGEWVGSLVAGFDFEDLAAMGVQIERLKAQLEAMGDNTTSPKFVRLSAELDKLNAIYNLQVELINNASRAREKQGKSVASSTAGTKKNAKATEESAEAEKLSAKAIEERNEALESATKLRARQQEDVDEYLESLEFEIELLGQTEREQAILTAIRSKGAYATDEQLESIRELTGALYDEKEATDQAEESIVQLTKSVDPWNEALTGMAERIDTEFSGAWKSAFDGTLDGFDDFAKSMKDALLDTLAEMAHLALTRPIVVGVTGAMGFGASGSAAAQGASGAGGIGQITGAISSGYSALTSGLGGTYGGLYASGANVAGNLGLYGAEEALNAQALNIGNMSGWQAAGYGALNIGAGMAGGYLGGQVFGESKEAGYGSAIGGTVGSIWGPIGTAIGSFIGSGIGSLFEKGVGNNAAAAEFDLSQGTIDSITWGNNKSDPENVTASKELAALLGPLAQLVRGSTYKGRVQVGAKSGIQLDGKRMKDAAEFIDVAFENIVMAASNLDEGLKELILGFDGTTEQLTTFAGAVIALDELSDINTVTQAIEDFNREQPTLQAAYDDQTTMVQTLIDNFDGSAMAAEEMAQALAQNKAAAYEFATAIQSIARQLGIVSKDQAAYIRESVMTADALRKARVAERASLANALNTLSNPQEVEKSARRMLELNRQIFDSLTDEQQLQQSETFAGFAQLTNDISQRILGEALTGLQGSQDDMNQRVSRMLEFAADKQQQAAQLQYDAAQTFGQWVQALTSIQPSDLGEVVQ